MCKCSPFSSHPIPSSCQFWCPSYSIFIKYGLPLEVEVLIKDIELEQSPNSLGRCGNHFNETLFHLLFYLFSNIYCHGPLLHTVQMSGLFKDSKTFVDMKLRNSPGQVLRNFDLFMREHKQSPSKQEIGSFVNANFEEAGSEFAVWDPADWHPDPLFIKNVSDPRLRTWATQLHSYWKELGRKIKEDVRDRPELYSMIYTSQPVIVPGGRFREFFYWDSYWIMKGNSVTV